MAKGIRASIFRDSYRTPYPALGGVSMVTVIGIEGGEIFEADDEAPAVRLVKRTIIDREVVHAEPIAKPANTSSPMMGGAFIHTSDSRFSRAAGSYGAVALHDLCEPCSLSMGD